MGFHYGDNSEGRQIYEKIRQACLRIRVKMQFRLLYDVRSTAARQQALDQNGQDLRYSKANVSEVCAWSVSRPGENYLKQV
jgi:hypothetical protein